MSTKIYNGFKIHTPNIHVVMKTLAEIGQEYAKVRAVINAQRVANVAMLIADQRALNTPAVPPRILVAPVLEAHDEITERQQKITQTRLRDPAMDDDLSITVIPLRGRSFALAMVFTDRDEYREVVMGHRHVEPFGYWDNTDPEDGVSASAWARRGQLWDEALGGDGSKSPGEVGLSRDYNGRYFPIPTYAELKQHLPTIPQRAAALFNHREQKAEYRDFMKRARRATLKMITEAVPSVKPTPAGAV